MLSYGQPERADSQALGQQTATADCLQRPLDSASAAAERRQAAQRVSGHSTCLRAVFLVKKNA